MTYLQSPHSELDCLAFSVLFEQYLLLILTLYYKGKEKLAISIIVNWIRKCKDLYTRKDTLLLKKFTLMGFWLPFFLCKHLKLLIPGRLPTKELKNGVWYYFQDIHMIWNHLQELVYS